MCCRMQAVRRYLGRRYVIFCAVIQYLNLFAIGGFLQPV